MLINIKKTNEEPFYEKYLLYYHSLHWIYCPLLCRSHANPGNSVINGLGYMWNPSKVVVQEAREDAGGKRVWVKVDELMGAEIIAAKKAELEGSKEKRIVTITVWRQLKNPQLWLAAAGQIFFSLSVGFGILMTYASYLKKTDDVVLSGLTATSTNELCEVALGGLITVPAGFAFLVSPFHRRGNRVFPP